MSKTTILLYTAIYIVENYYTRTNGRVVTWSSIYLKRHLVLLLLWSLFPLRSVCTITAPADSCVMAEPEPEPERGKRSQAEATAITGLIAPSALSRKCYQNSLLMVFQLSAVWQVQHCSPGIQMQKKKTQSHTFHNAQLLSSELQELVQQSTSRRKCLNWYKDL